MPSAIHGHGPAGVGATMTGPDDMIVSLELKHPVNVPGRRSDLVKGLERHLRGRGRRGGRAGRGLGGDDEGNSVPRW